MGGIDVTDLGGDRYDTPEHPGRGRMGWHDVASRLRGPAVADVGRHLAQRWQAVTGERLEAQPGVGSAGDVELQIVRTVPEKLYDFAPRGDFRIIEAYLRALRSAQHLVYLENQFLWSPEIVNILAEKLRRPPTDQLRVVIMLPGKPNNGEDDTRGQLSLLAEADGDHGRFLATTMRARSGNTSDRVYVLRRSESSTTAGSRSAPRISTRTPSLTTARSTLLPATRRSRATPDCDCGPPISNVTSKRSLAARAGSSTNSGARSRPSSASAGTAVIR